MSSSPYPDDWYDDPKMLEPLLSPTDVWGRRDHKHDLAFRPLETSLLEGKVDAIYTLSKHLQHLQEDTGQIKAIEDLSRYPDWTVQVANTPAVITCTDVMAEEHPERRCHVNRRWTQGIASAPFQAVTLAFFHTLNASFRSCLNVVLPSK